MAFEKVSPQHPDKIADRIAGAIVDHCYTHSDGGWLKSNPMVAVEVLLGHGKCYVMIETSCTRAELSCNDVDDIVHRIVGDVEIFVTICDQDPELSKNQKDGIKAADNGIFRGCAPTQEQKLLTAIAHSIYERFPTDGKYVIGRYRRRNKEGMVEPSEPDDRSLALTICQSGAKGGIDGEILDWWQDYGNRNCWTLQEKYSFRFGRTAENKPRYISLTKVNPLGEWTGGPAVDCGATNRKLGSDMGDGVTGGGLHGKDLSKADVSVNIWCYLESIRTGQPVTACCSIGDETVNGIPYADIVEQARLYIHTLGGFERFAEWGLIRHRDL